MSLMAQAAEDAAVEDLANIVLGLVAYDGPERRATPRMAVQQPVAVRSVDESLLPVGPLSTMIALDISAGGMALLSRDPFTGDHLMLDLQSKGQRIELLLEVVRNKQLSDWCYEIGGRFVPWRPAEPLE